jgi:methionine synthase II (cobalamin-independent)
MTTMQKISKNITIEQLITEYAQSVRFLMDTGIKCLACGEPVWGTLESNAKEKGFSDAEIDNIVQSLNSVLAQKS